VVIYPVDIDFIAARIPMIILGIILGVYVYRWTRELFGVNAGLMALFIYTFSPNILAHTRLITHDISAICFMFIALYYFWRFNKTPTRKNLVLSGITLGFALLSKFSGVLGYGFMSQRLLDLSDGHLNFTGIRLPAGAYINGIVLHLHHTKVIPRQFFLMGVVSMKTWWYFYIVGLLVKVPIAAIIFFCLGLLDFRKKRFLNLVDGSFLAIPVIFIFLYFSFFVPVNRGLRYILPVFPFVFVFIGGAVSQQMKGKWMKAIIIALGLWYVVSSVRIFPHYLSYFNEFAGGPDNGYKYLVDSDLDWGQDLKGLKSYMEKRNINKIKLDYFGYLDPKHYRIKHEKLKSLPTSGYVAVSATNLQNVYSDTPDYSYLRTLQPVDKIGYSIFIYSLAAP
jgi:4-amino-4-deoxy-L-arabinose transferase-like glycosyltransferase